MREGRAGNGKLEAPTVACMVLKIEKLTDSPRTTYDVLLAGTDPALVTMQIDIGWTYIAGVDPIALFKAHPGRFELWHIKVTGHETIQSWTSPSSTPALP